MKPQTVLIAFFYGLVTLILLPLLFIWLNFELSLPSYSFLMFRLVGFILILFGTAFWLYSISLFHFSGKGTPVPTSPPRKLVTNGVYKYTRNPMYISVLLILLGYFIIFGQLLLILNLFIVAFFFHLFITRYEEPTLNKKFGKSYTEYCNKVPRWL